MIKHGVKAMNKDLLKRVNVAASNELATLSVEQMLAVVGGLQRIVPIAK